MAQITPKLEILVSLTQPSEEIANVISAFLAHHPGKEIEILRTVREQIDEALAQLDGREAE
jgi:hypothetical protein